MSDFFQGVLCKEDIDSRRLPAGCVYRRIQVPGLSSGVRFLFEPQTTEETLLLIERLPLRDHALYLRYEPVNGHVFSLQGFRLMGTEVVAGSAFDAEPPDDASAEFVRIMREFEVPIGDDGYFAAFQRGFWGRRWP